MKNAALLLSMSVLFLSSCSSVKMISGEGVPNRTIGSVEFIAANEKASPKKGMVGNFKLVEDNNPDWNYISAKLKKFARQNGANLIQVRTIGWGKKGHAFYVDGTLYYLTDTLQKSTEVSPPCVVYLMRDKSESPLSSIFKIEVKIEDTDFGTLPQHGFVEKAFTDCFQGFTVMVNSKAYPLLLNGESRYFRVAKQTSANAIGTSISIGIGGVFLVEMKNKELARLLMYQN